MPLWTPFQDATRSADDVATNTGHLRFDTIDFEQVLSFGTELLASGGAEYETDPELLDPQQRLANQKSQLEKRMGVASDFMGLDSLLDDTDFTVPARPLSFVPCACAPPATQPLTSPGGTE